MERKVDVAALYSALDSKRQSEKKSWRQLAVELSLSASVFTRLAQGKRPDLDSFISMTGWLGQPADSFIEGDKPSEAEAEETVAVISTYLRADKSLKPASAQAIEDIVRTAYEQLAEN
jgi:transcriptional regulator with XRE-family HTH domain